jgi:hypothetical protein
MFRIGKVVRIKATNTSDATVEVYGVVTALTDTSGTPNKIKIRTLAAVTNIKNGTTNESVDLEVLAVGSAFAQGRESVTGERFNKPVEFANYTQIFRTPFSLTGTAMKSPLRYDVKGPHQDKAKEHSVEHMVDIEQAILFGYKSKYVASGDADPTTGAGLPLTTTGGIIYHLQRWEAGDYGTVTATLDTDADKRIITNAAGTIDEDTFDGWMERLFKRTNNTTNEKLCICGSGALRVLNQLWRSKSVLNTQLPSKATYGMSVTSLLTPWGTVHFKSHPLFCENPDLQYSGLFLDVRNMKLRPMKDRDTKVLANRQANDADYRKDEWFTEIGFEMWFPESHLYVKDMGSNGYTP